MSGFAGNMVAIFTTSCGKVIVFPFKPLCCDCGPPVDFSFTMYIFGRYLQINNLSDSVRPVSSGGVFPI